MIAVLTSGGDAPGMNAVIAGVHEADGAVLAVQGGFRGLAEGHVVTFSQGLREIVHLPIEFPAN